MPREDRGHVEHRIS